VPVAASSKESIVFTFPKAERIFPACDKTVRLRENI
jgi:hypothetical protein